MVANGYGITLVPKVAVDVEVRRHARPTVRPGSGAAKRTSLTRSSRTSPRKADFIALGELVSETLGGAAISKRQSTKPRKRASAR
jgi:LysR family hydrogen peroxide-inducible transcriptional activator